MKLWDKGYNVDKQIENYTVGNDRELDTVIAKYDVLASKAHAKMLAKVGLITEEEGILLVDELEKLIPVVSSKDFIIEEEFEDIHSKIEHHLIEKLGDVGKKIHTARSRNDQVLVAMHLYLKAHLSQIKTLTKILITKLLEAAKKYEHIKLPGYTHLQVAMPSSFGMWFSAYAETLIDDLFFVDAALNVVDQNPLGSAAGYGSCFPIDREYTTKILGFNTLKVNSVAAQMSRGKAEKSSAIAISTVASSVSKMAMDICLYMSQNFNFISLSKEFTTGSSIMPHKKNPDVFELVRGNCNLLQNLPQKLNAITSNLPSGYHRDLQLVKESTVQGIETMLNTLEIVIHAIKEIEVNDNILDNNMYNPIYSVDTLNKYISEGMNFRDAYKLIGKQIENNEFTPDTNVAHTHIGSIGNLRLDLIEEKLNLL
jgi:argininosuccinate lyase